MLKTTPWFQQAARAGLIATIVVTLGAACSTDVLRCGDSSGTPEADVLASPSAVPMLTIVTPTPVTPTTEPTGEALPTTPPENPETYVVAEGDTLYAIALRFNVPLNELIAHNGLSDPNDIQVGQELRIPPKP